MNKTNSIHNVSDDKQIVVSNISSQIVLLALLCIMSVQPLVGIFANIYNPTDPFGTLAAINNLFFKKSQWIRYDGYICLFAAIILSMIQRGQSLGEWAKGLVKNKIWNTFFFVLLGWIIFNVFVVSPELTISLAGDANRYEGLFSIIAYAGFFAAASLLQNKGLRMIWFRFTIAVACILSVCGLYAYWAENPVILSYMQPIHAGTVQVTFPQYNHFGYYLAISIMISVGLFFYATSKIEKTLYIIAAALLQFTLATNGTRGAMLAVILGTTLICLFLSIRRETTKKNIILVCVVLVIACLPAVTFFQRFLTIFADLGRILNLEANRDTAGSGRWRLWGGCLRLIKEKPITGYGLNSAYYMMKSAIGYSDMPHNEYLQHAVDLGIPGMLLYLAALGSLFATCIKNLKKLPRTCIIAGCAAITYGASAFFGVTLVHVVPFFYILLGLVKWNDKVDDTQINTEDAEVDKTTAEEVK